MVAACYLVVMVGAAVFVHIPNGIFVASGGWELVGAIAAVLLALAVGGLRAATASTTSCTTGRCAWPRPTLSSAVTTTFRPVDRPSHALRPDHSARATAFVEPSPDGAPAERRRRSGPPTVS